MSSRIPGFYRLPIAERQAVVAKLTGISVSELATLAQNGGMDLSLADHMVENVFATFALPMGVALNFQINGEDVLVPMVIEEPSVVAAASNAARLIRDGGGFVAESDPAHMIAQVELKDVKDIPAAIAAIQTERTSILVMCDDAQPGFKRRGGGARDMEVRVLDATNIVVHLIIDTCDAMGANAINTVAEKVSPYLAKLASARVGLRILSNLADRRRVRVRCRVPLTTLADGEASGEGIRDLIVEASRFAELDPYRAATHNKGIMNGVDAVALATGQDWRGLEAGAHAFAARHGRYEALSVWRAARDGALEGVIELPMPVGTVGGAVTVHPGARLAMRMLGQPDACRLGQVIAAAGLASNFAAIRALATVGIQRGHMNLHERRVRFHKEVST